MDRRSFLRTTSAAAALGVPALSSLTTRAVASGPTAREASGAGGRTEITSTLAPWAPAQGDWNVTTVNHLYRRAGFGAKYSEITAALTKNYSAVVDALMDDALLTGGNLPGPPEHSDQWLHVQPYLGTDLNTQSAQQTAYSYAMLAIRRQWTSLMADPKTMLRERMAMFWMNHFVIEETKVYYPQSVYNYVNYFRQHPWGNFKQMVKDVTVSPAMLIYLDGQLSYGAHPNENYARELMELFTLGVTYKDGSANYTETDIQQMARALTGWYVDVTAVAPNVLPGVYSVARHDSTFKTPFGAPAKDYGLAASGVVTDDVIDLLFQMKGDRLAWYISSKLYQLFVYHDITTPSAISIIDGLAATFQNSNWELKPVIAQLLKSEHFFDSANIGAQIKSPYDFMIGLVRSLDLGVDQYQGGTLYYYGYYSNQELLDPPNVKGWPGYHSWISTTTLPQRNSFAGALAVTAGGIPAIGATGYNSMNDTGIVWTDAQVTAWASQFPDYSGTFTNFLDQVSQYLCAIKPSKTALQAKILSYFPNSYEWPTLSDSDKLNPIRLVVGALAQFANYQLT